ncbi:hypothetical protein [Vulcanisaeta sp. JCM 16161]|uniref:hypothetical protein n=1 Tax=Vulcanisaeta sp. JCM 16161 TaxID=1295372 RepID=UPI000AFB86D5|nr:hypothetical protein [Vulcanisaeta sp. JCM 16161]
MHKIAKRMLRLLKRARERWLSTYKPELEELINELGSGGARVIISGDPFDSNKPFVVHLYAEKLAVAISRVRNSVMVNITLAGLEGVHVITLKLINDEVLRASQCGLMLTDGSIDKDGYPIMNTNRLWQAVIFPLTFPGKVHVYINGLSVNDGGVSVVWQLRLLTTGVCLRARPRLPRMLSN